MNGCVVLIDDRSPSTSFHGSVLLSWMCSMPPPVAMSTWPLPPCSDRLRTSSAPWRFQAKSSSPVWSTARAADAASPPPFISNWNLQVADEVLKRSEQGGKGHV